MSGTAKSYNDIGETGEMDFEWERNHNWYYARVIGPFDITYAQVSGNLQQSIWSTFFTEKQTPSSRILKNIMGGPYPIEDFFQILCGGKSKYLKMRHLKHKTIYYNDHTKVIVSDFHHVGGHKIPQRIEVHLGDDHLTVLEISSLEFEHTPMIASSEYQAQKVRIMESRR